MNIYAKMTQADFNNYLERLLEGMTARELLAIGGIYEIVAEEFNNDVLDAWRADQFDAAGE